MFRSRNSVETTGLGLHGQLSTDAHPDLLTTATAAAIAITAQGGQDCGATTLLSSEDASVRHLGPSRVWKEDEEHGPSTSYTWSYKPYIISRVITYPS